MTPAGMRALLLVLVLALLAPHVAHACKIDYVPLFKVLDASATVAVVRVRARNSKAVLHVIEPIKGAPGKSIPLDFKLVGGHTSCDPHLRGTGIVFLTAEREFAAAYDSFPRAESGLLDAIKAYASAKDASERAAALVDAIVKSKHDRTEFDAALTLVDDPDALASVTSQDRDRLLAALPNVKRRDSSLPFVLARLGVDAQHLQGDAAELAKARTFEGVTSADDLADIIAATPKGPSPRAVAAFERCERVRRRQRNEFRQTIDVGLSIGLDWAIAANLCRN